MGPDHTGKGLNHRPDHVPIDLLAVQVSTLSRHNLCLRFHNNFLTKQLGSITEQGGRSGEVCGCGEVVKSSDLNFETSELSAVCVCVQACTDTRVGTHAGYHTPGF